MTLLISADPAPLRLDDSGTVRVGNTRITLDTVIRAYLSGAGADEIAGSFPALSLADVHATIAYYLKHKSEVDAYLERRQVEADALRTQVEAMGDTRAMRERLRSQRTQ